MIVPNHDMTMRKMTAILNLIWFDVQIYDAGEFSLLCNESASGTTQWTGGDFIAIDRVIVWNSSGQAYLYKLPAK